MATKKKKKGNAKTWEVGGAVTAAALAAAAGTYLLSDKKTKTKAKRWVAAARAEALKKAKTAAKLGEKDYGRIVEQAVKRYGALGKMTAADMMAAAKELKGDWKKMHAATEKLTKAYAPKKPSHPKKKAAHARKARR